METLSALLVAFGLIFVAELGDKSQLLSLWFATRYRLGAVLAGVVVAVVVLQAVAVLVGVAFEAVLPERVFLTLAGVAFLVFAAWSLRIEEEDLTEQVDTRMFGPIGIVAGSFLLSEMGDKTQLATVTLAGSRDAIGVWIGSTLAMIGSNVLAVGLGRFAGARLPRAWIARGSAMLFVVFGVITLWEAWG